jgi:hypothetical protein
LKNRAILYILKVHSFLREIRMGNTNLVRSPAEVQRFCEDLLARIGTNKEQIAAYVLKVEGPRHGINRERLRAVKKRGRAAKRRGLK